VTSKGAAGILRRTCVSACGGFPRADLGRSSMKWFVWTRVSPVGSEAAVDTGVPFEWYVAAWRGDSGTTDGGVCVQGQHNLCGGCGCAGAAPFGDEGLFGLMALQVSRLLATRACFSYGCGSVDCYGAKQGCVDTLLCEKGGAVAVPRPHLVSV